MLSPPRLYALDELVPTNPRSVRVFAIPESNANHAGKQRNPLGGRSLSDWLGDATPKATKGKP